MCIRDRNPTNRPLYSNYVVPSSFCGKNPTFFFYRSLGMARGQISTQTATAPTRTTMTISEAAEAVEATTTTTMTLEAAAEAAAAEEAAVTAVTAMARWHRSLRFSFHPGRCTRLGLALSTVCATTVPAGATGCAPAATGTGARGWCAGVVAAWGNRRRRTFATTAATRARRRLSSSMVRRTRTRRRRRSPTSSSTRALVEGEASSRSVTGCAVSAPSTTTGWTRTASSRTSATCASHQRR